MTPFDTFLHAVITQGTNEARRDRSATVEAQHLLLAIADEPEPTTREPLVSVGLDRPTIRDALDREFEQSLRTAGVSLAAFGSLKSSPASRQPTLGASAKLAMERGFSATSNRKKDLRPAHLLLGVLLAEIGTVPRALVLAGVDRAELAARVRQSITDNG